MTREKLRTANRFGDVFTFVFQTLPAVITLIVLVLITIVYGIFRLVF